MCCFLSPSPLTRCTATWRRWLYKWQGGVPYLLLYINLCDSGEKTGGWSKAHRRQPTRLLRCHGFCVISHTHIHNAVCLSRLVRTLHTCQSWQDTVNPENRVRKCTGKGFHSFCDGSLFSQTLRAERVEQWVYAILIVPHTLCGGGSEINICTATSCSHIK